MANIHATRAVSVVIEADLLAPSFLPLTELAAGCLILPSQCTLTLTGTPSPMEAALMLCEPGTELGDPGDAILQVGEHWELYSDLPLVLPGGNVPPLEQGGVLGLYVPVALLMAGARVEGHTQRRVRDLAGR